MESAQMQSLTQEQKEYERRRALTEAQQLAADERIALWRKEWETTPVPRTCDICKCDLAEQNTMTATLSVRGTLGGMYVLKENSRRPLDLCSRCGVRLFDVISEAKLSLYRVKRVRVIKKTDLVKRLEIAEARNRSFEAFVKTQLGWTDPHRPHSREAEGIEADKKV